MEDNTLVVSIPEAAPTDDQKSLQFKVVAEYRDNGQTKTSTVMRTYAQMQWLQSKLVENHRNEIVPVLPEAPTVSSLQDKEYIEKKRRQFDRFVVRVASRPSFVGDADLRSFLTSAALSMDGVDKKKTNALLNALKLEHGIRMYKPSLHHDDDDEADFEKRRMFILQSERDFKVVLDHIQHAIRNRGQVGKQIATALSAAAALDEDAGAFHDLVRRLGELGLQAETTYRTQAREEIFHLGDILLDYRNNSEALKTLLNHRTEMLIELDSHLKTTQKAAEHLEKLKRKLSDASTEVTNAAAELDQLHARTTELTAQYKQFRRDIASEFARFEKEKADDFRMALDHFVRTHINAEQEKLDQLTEMGAFLRTLTA